MNRRMLLISLTVLVALALLLIVSVALAQGGGRQGGQGGQRGSMGDMVYLERSWTAVSFQLDCTTEQLTQLRPTYRNTLNARNEALKQAMADHDREAMGKAMTDAKTRLETKLKSVLSTSQFTKLQQLMTMGGGGRRGGQGGGNH